MIDEVSMMGLALVYARAGYKILPVTPRGKIPLTEHGAHDSTTEENIIREWWTRWPNANIALVLDGLVAVDIDPRNGGNVDHLPHTLPETCFAKTGGGGWHYLYQARNGTKYLGTLGTGIDLKSGAGSYIVVEPSVHASGEKYVWLDETEPWTTTPAVAPEWLARQVGPKTSGTHADGTGTIPEGQRNTHLTSLAGAVQRKNMAPAAILAALLAENAARCTPPLADDEVAKIAESVARYTPAASTETHGWPASLDLALLAQREPKAPQSIMEGVPVGYATGVFGHGGAGKSQIELMRAVCIASGAPFCGMDVLRRRVLYVSCEDRADILHWRLTRICAHLGVDLAGLRDWLRVIDLVGCASILYAPDRLTGLPLTSAYGTLAERMREYGTEVLVLDGITDVFGGNENARAEVKHFVNLLLALIPADTGALILIGHVNKTTAAAGSTGEGYSGSTAWHNSVRARWYLRPETTDRDDEQPQRTGKLILELQKANHGEVGAQIEFTWDQGAHLFIGRRVEDGMEFDRKQRDIEEQAGVRRAIKACIDAAEVVPAAMTGPRTAFHVLKVRPDFPTSLCIGRAGTRRFWRHVEELRAMKHLTEEHIARKTDRHLVRLLVLTQEGMRACGQ